MRNPWQCFFGHDWEQVTPRLLIRGEFEVVQIRYGARCRRCGETGLISNPKATESVQYSYSETVSQAEAEDRLQAGLEEHPEA